MPEIGPMEILVVAVVALLVFGPEKLPEMARNVGKTISDLRRTAQEMRDEFSTGFDDEPSPRTRRTRPAATEDPDDDADYVVEDEPADATPRRPADADDADEGPADPPDPPDDDDEETAVADGSASERSSEEPKT
jgi:sec-independent protein translocase protein TatB